VFIKNKPFSVLPQSVAVLQEQSSEKKAFQKLKKTGGCQQAFSSLFLHTNFFPNSVGRKRNIGFFRTPYIINIIMESNLVEANTKTL